MIDAKMLSRELLDHFIRGIAMTMASSIMAGGESVQERRWAIASWSRSSSDACAADHDYSYACGND